MTTEPTPMMECGHSANATHKGEPCCVICFGITPGARTVVAQPDSSRVARCTYFGTVPSGRNHESNYGCKRGSQCDCERPSSTSLPFFGLSKGEFDTFYCGCRGWD